MSARHVPVAARVRLLLAALAVVAVTLEAPAQTPAGQAVGKTARAVPSPTAAAWKTAALPKPPPGSAVVWFLGHCAFAVRTADHLLIFDYQEKYGGGGDETPAATRELATGWVDPQEIKGLKVRVFVSHQHDDHLDPVIYTWARVVPDIQYYVGWEPEKGSPAHGFLGPRAELKQPDLEIATINTQSPGAPEVAWLVRVDGLAIYHNGDVQLRKPEAEHDFLKARSGRVSIAFLPAIVTLRGKPSPQTVDFFTRLKVSAVFPMHGAVADPAYFKLEKAMKAQFPGVRMYIPTRMGQRYFFERGRVTGTSGGAGSASGKAPAGFP
jgi:L-ascorbate metabolism protein UlaG (beta-lactamase superfamily)